MGLDMYLTKKTYVQRWDHQAEEEKFDVTVKKGGKIYKAIQPERIQYIEEQVMYWRKANHIHRWFVDNVQDGNDNCGTYYVDEKQLEELRDTCSKVVESLEKSKKGTVSTKVGFSGGKDLFEDVEVFEDTSVAEELLPTTRGFFFGGAEYDKWYFEDTKRTAMELEKILNEERKEGDFYYQSSW